MSKKARFLRSQMSKEYEKNIKKAIQVNARLQSSWFFISYKYLLYMPSIQHIYLSLLLNFNSSKEQKAHDDGDVKQRNEQKKLQSQWVSFEVS